MLLALKILVIVALTSSSSSLYIVQAKNPKQPNNNRYKYTTQSRGENSDEQILYNKNDILIDTLKSHGLF